MKRLALAIFGVVAATQAHATDLAAHGSWSSLAGDRSAHGVGDVLTVVIYENSSATNTAENSTSKNTAFQGALSIGNPSTGSNVVNGAANFGLGHTADNAGATTRAGQMVAQISVTVDNVFPNGDLHVMGVQALKINGEKTNIKVQGRVRLADITASNAVLSSSLADASIDYDGQGFVSASSQPGIFTRIFNWLDIP
ncbi:MAG TPA: flagellar basal body L-ring protein FlgH [Rhizomicrobium sp.]|nr:flagellar basal body L-ring protein FlgH [Rhizomicrobium sp.]